MQVVDLRGPAAMLRDGRLEERRSAQPAARIEVDCSRDAIELIDEFRHRGIDAGLAETPHAWHVAVEHAPGDQLQPEVARILAHWLAKRAAPATNVHVGRRLYVVESAAVHADGLSVVAAAGAAPPCR
jgi:hypothetical protein